MQNRLKDHYHVCQCVILSIMSQSRKAAKVMLAFVSDRIIKSKWCKGCYTTRDPLLSMNSLDLSSSNVPHSPHVFSLYAAEIQTLIVCDPSYVRVRPKSVCNVWRRNAKNQNIIFYKFEHGTPYNVQYSGILVIWNISLRYTIILDYKKGTDGWYIPSMGNCMW